MTLPPIPTAGVVIIGNEILSGRTPDANLNVIAKKLHELGIRLLEARVVPDIESEIIVAVNAMRSLYTYVFTTGGIGPTHDDITAHSIAKAFNTPLIEHPEAKALLMAHYTADRINEARLRMARIPQGAELIPNSVSAAPGFRMENVFVMAGVPNIMQAMLEQVAPTLQRGPTIFSIAVSGAVPESTVAEELRGLAGVYTGVDIGSYPWFRNGSYGTVLVARGTDLAHVKAVGEALFSLMAKHNGNPEVENS